MNYYSTFKQSCFWGSLQCSLDLMNPNPISFKPLNGFSDRIFCIAFLFNTQSINPKIKMNKGNPIPPNNRIAISKLSSGISSLRKYLKINRMEKRDKKMIPVAFKRNAILCLFSNKNFFNITNSIK